MLSGVGAFCIFNSMRPVGIAEHFKVLVVPNQRIDKKLHVLSATIQSEPNE